MVTYRDGKRVVGLESLVHSDVLQILHLIRAGLGFLGHLRL